MSVSPDLWRLVAVALVIIMLYELAWRWSHRRSPAAQRRRTARATARAQRQLAARRARHEAGGAHG